MFPNNRIPCFAVLLALIWGATAFAQHSAVPARPTATSEAEELKRVLNQEAKNPAVEAVLETKPKTPSEQLRAAKALADLERPDLARQFLKQILDANLDAAQLTSLATEFGAGVFVHLASRKELAPEAPQLSQAILQAARSQAIAPEHIATLIQQLHDSSADVRFQALEGLRSAREAAVGPLVAVLADPARSAEHAQVRAALVHIGPDAVPPLVGVLQSPDPALKTAVLQVLADLKSRPAMVWFLAPATAAESDPALRNAAREGLKKLMGQDPTPPEAVQLLAKQAQRYWERQEPLPETLPGQTELWSWEPEKQTPAVWQGSVAEASRRLATWLARDAHAIDPQNEAITILYLATLLEEARYAHGLDQPLEQGPGTAAAEVAAAGPEVVEKVLRLALDTNHAAAATAAATLLGELGHSEKLLYQGAEPAPLVRALRHPDRRLRLAATAAILKLAPVQPFPGSSRIPETLTFLASTHGTPRAVVATPTSAEALRIGGYLEGLGYQVDTATNGDQALRLAMASPDQVFVYLDSTLDNPPLHLVLQQLRHDCRTALLPVGVFARDGQGARADHLIRQDPLALSFPRPHDLETMRWQVDELLALRAAEAVALPERQRQAALAWDLLLMMTSAPQQEFYRLKGAESAALTALYVPALSVRAASFLGALGTAEGQKALVDLASRSAQPLEVRQAALAAFRQAVQKYGVMLTSQEILRQYTHYNESTALDAPTRQVLGLILDCIEAPTRTPTGAEGAAPAAGSEPRKDG